MFRNRLTFKRTIAKCEMSADDWQLYNKPGCIGCATALNQTLVTLVNSGQDRDSVRSLMHEAMEQYRTFGAFDTEPRAVLEDILDKIFG